MIEAMGLYNRALSAPLPAAETETPLIVFEDGSPASASLARCLAPAGHLDQLLLRDIEGPVLDVGCGPGRHLRALSALGIYGLGVDLSQSAVMLACTGGARAMVADIFGEIPGVGAWRTALLLDGNIGIGGDPVRLLERLGELLVPDGVVLVELGPPEVKSRTARARLEMAGERSGFFPWACLAARDVAGIATQAQMTIDREWTCEGRWFARLRSPARS